MKLRYFQLLLLALLLGKTSIGQKIEKFYNFQWKETTPEQATFYSLKEKTDSGWIQHDYYVREKKLQMKGRYLDTAGKIPVGNFIYFYPNGNAESLGKYINGKKDGIWLKYSHSGFLIDSQTYKNGNLVGTNLSWYTNGYLRDSSVYNQDGSGISFNWFDNGNTSSAGKYTTGMKETGKWLFFHKNGKPSSEEIYDNGKLISKKYFDENGSPVMDTTNQERRAAIKSGNEGWQKYLQKNLYFPSQYKIQNADQVVVVIGFAIDENGKVEQAMVTQSFHPEFDKIALDIIRKSPDWIPAIDKHNRKIKSFRRQPVTFAQVTL